MGRDHLEDLSVDGRIILRCMCKKWDGGGWAWIGLIWLRIGTGSGCCECGIEQWSCIKYGEFIY